MAAFNGIMLWCEEPNQRAYVSEISGRNTKNTETRTKYNMITFIMFVTGPTKALLIIVEQTPGSLTKCRICFVSGDIHVCRSR